MPHIIEDRILESSTTTGTGDITLAGAVTGFRAFADVCAVADTVPYFIEAVDALGQPTGDYEYGVGTYSAANTLTRTTVTASSNGGAAVNFAAGSKNVGLALTALEFGKLSSHVTTDVTASRAKATNYTNNTGRVIHVVISGSNSLINGYARFSVNGVTLDGPQSYAATAIVNISFAVGVGEVYRLDDFSGVFTISKWVELR